MKTIVKIGKYRHSIAKKFIIALPEKKTLPSKTDTFYYFVIVLTICIFTFLKKNVRSWFIESVTDSRFLLSSWKEYFVCSFVCLSYFFHL